MTRLGSRRADHTVIVTPVSPFAWKCDSFAACSIFCRLTQRWRCWCRDGHILARRRLTDTTAMQVWRYSVLVRCWPLMIVYASPRSSLGNTSMYVRMQVDQADVRPLGSKGIRLTLYSARSRVANRISFAYRAPRRVHVDASAP